MSNKRPCTTPTIEPSPDVPFADDAPRTYSAAYFRWSAVAAMVFFVVGVGGLLLWCFGTDPVDGFTEHPPAYNMTACHVCAQLSDADKRASTFTRYGFYEKVCPATAFPGVVEWVPMKHISPTCCCPVTTTTRKGDTYYYRLKDSPLQAAAANAPCTCSYQFQRDLSAGEESAVNWILAMIAVVTITCCWCCVLLCQATCCNSR